MSQKHALINIINRGNINRLIRNTDLFERVCYVMSILSFWIFKRGLLLIMCRLQKKHALLKRGNNNRLMNKYIEKWIFILCAMWYSGERQYGL